MCLCVYVCAHTPVRCAYALVGVQFAPSEPARDPPTSYWPLTESMSHTRRRLLVTCSGPLFLSLFTMR